MIVTHLASADFQCQTNYFEDDNQASKNTNDEDDDTDCE
jgi:hypothetical protein